jgi:uncharacterized membrane protein YdjX (TVP38/TMEM64 family)
MAEPGRMPGHQSRPYATRDRRDIWTLVWAGAITLLVALAWARPEMWHLAQTASQRMHLAQARDLIAPWGAWAPAASVLLMIVHTVLPFPAEILIAANGALFGFWAGLGVSWIGAMASACLPFGIARAMGRGETARIIPRDTLAWVDALVMRGDWTVALVVRFIPLFPFSVFNFALGRTPLSWRTFLWTSGVGVLPALASAVAAGYAAEGAPNLLPWALSVWLTLMALGLIFRHRVVRPIVPAAADR